MKKNIKNELTWMKRMKMLREGRREKQLKKKLSGIAIQKSNSNITAR